MSLRGQLILAPNHLKKFLFTQASLQLHRLWPGNTGFEHKFSVEYRWNNLSLMESFRNDYIWFETGI